MAENGGHCDAAIHANLTNGLQNGQPILCERFTDGIKHGCQCAVA